MKTTIQLVFVGLLTLSWVPVTSAQAPSEPVSTDAPVAAPLSLKAWGPGSAQLVSDAGLDHLTGTLEVAAQQRRETGVRFHIELRNDGQRPVTLEQLLRRITFSILQPDGRTLRGGSPRAGDYHRSGQWLYPAGPKPEAVALSPEDAVTLAPGESRRLTYRMDDRTALDDAGKVQKADVTPGRYEVSVSIGLSSGGELAKATLSSVRMPFEVVP